MEATSELANKRVPVTPSVWAALSDLRQPGETFDALIIRLITDHQAACLERELAEIDSMDEFIPLEQAKKELGL